MTDTRGIELANKVLPKLIQLQEHKDAMAVLEAETDRLRAEVQAEMQASGLMQADIGEWRASIVQSNRTTLDKKKLLGQGVTMEQIEAATVTTPGKPHLRIAAKATTSHEDNL
jgi:hypothetical protein